MMELGSLTHLLLLLAVYLLLIIVFHLGKYPPPLVSSGSLRREGAEAALIFGVILVIRWLKIFYPFTSTLNWTIYVIGVYLGVSLGLSLIMEGIVRKRSLSSIGFRLPMNRKVLMIFTVIVGLQLVGRITSYFLTGAEFPVFDAYFVSGVILGPFYEETVFRGLIQTRLEAGLGSVKSWILTGLLFGFYHYWAHFLIAKEALTIFSSLQIIQVTLIGMLFGVIFTKTRSLLPPFLLHAVTNFVAFLGW